MKSEQDLNELNHDRDIVSSQDSIINPPLLKILCNLTIYLNIRLLTIQELYLLHDRAYKLLKIRRTILSFSHISQRVRSVSYEDSFRSIPPSRLYSKSLMFMLKANLFTLKALHLEQVRLLLRATMKLESLHVDDFPSLYLFFLVTIS